MKPLRLVLVTGRYWPMADDEARLLAELANELVRQGAEVTVLTAQWHKSWPREVVHRQVPVVRLPRSSSRMWGTFRYLRSLCQWLWERRQQIDAVYVSGMRDEAYSVLGTLASSGVRVVLRATGLGRGGDCHWQKTVHFGSRTAARCRTADAFVVSNEIAADELRVAGYPQQRIERISDGVPLWHGPPRDKLSRAVARASLADVHPVLAVREHAPLALYEGPIRENAGLFDLVAAWSEVLRRWPTARLWLAGDASGADDLWSEVQQSGLADAVVFPGAFDLLDAVLAATDLFVLAAREPLESVAMLEAMAAGVPVVATDTPFTQQLLAEGGHAALVPRGNAAALGEAMRRLLLDRDAAQHQADEARGYVEAQHGIEQMAAAHLSLFRRLVSAKALAMS